MGLCFSYQQNRDLDYISNLFSSLSFGTEINKRDNQVPSTEVPQTKDVPEHEPSTIYESKQIQADLTPPPTPPSSPPPDTNVSPEVLAREERRRKRDERRAARQQQNEEKFKLDLSMLPEEYLEDRCKLNIQTYQPYDEKKKCLVLDIDYTIFDHKSDFDLALEFKRPYLHEFLKICNQYYNIVIWSATAYIHIQTKMEKLQLFNHPDFQICFVLSRDHMIPYAFSLKRKTFIQDIKPLSLLWKKFPGIFNPSNTIHIDDVEENFVLNQRNGLRIEPFRDALLFRQTDRELFYLAQYLTMIAELPSFDPLDHNRWKDYIINKLWDMQTTLSLPTFTPPCAPSPLLVEQHFQSIVNRRNQKEEEKAKREEQKLLDNERKPENAAEWDRVLSQELVNLANSKESAHSVPQQISQQNPSQKTPTTSAHPSPLMYLSSPYIVPLPSPNKQNTPITFPSPIVHPPSPSKHPSPHTLSSTFHTPSLHFTPKLRKTPSPKLTIKTTPTSSPLITPQSPAHEKRHRRERSRGKETGKGDEEYRGERGGVVKAEWMVSDLHLMDLIRNDLLPTNNPILHAS